MAAAAAAEKQAKQEAEREKWAELLTAGQRGQCSGMGARGAGAHSSVSVPNTTSPKSRLPIMPAGVACTPPPPGTPHQHTGSYKHPGWHVELGLGGGEERTIPVAGLIVRDGASRTATCCGGRADGEDAQLGHDSKEKRRGGERKHEQQKYRERQGRRASNRLVAGADGGKGVTWPAFPPTGVKTTFHLATGVAVNMSALSCRHSHAGTLSSPVFSTVCTFPDPLNRTCQRGRGRSRFPPSASGCSYPLSASISLALAKASSFFSVAALDLSRATTGSATSSATSSSGCEPASSTAAGVAVVVSLIVAAAAVSRAAAAASAAASAAGSSGTAQQPIPDNIRAATPAPATATWCASMARIMARMVRLGYGIAIF